MRFILYFLLFSVSISCFSQGFGIPSKKGGIGFGNLPIFTGLRFNYCDKNVKKISGINVTVWQPKQDSVQTGTVNGISIGVPLTMGTANKNGINLGLLGAGASKNISGINIGGLGIGAGENVTGINIGGLGMGSGGNVTGLNVGGLGAGSGKNVTGINIGGLGIGAGENLSGFSFGGLGAGSGGKVSGITIGGIGVGAGKDLSGISIGGIGVGSGGNVTGITIAGIGAGCGGELRGLVIAGVAAGAPKTKAIIIAPAAGGQDVKGLMITPVWMKVGYVNRHNEDGQEVREEKEGTIKGVSISAFNQIRGEQRGITLGVVNYTKKIHGIQFGLINIVKENPKGLRVLPILNFKFKKKSEG